MRNEALYLWNTFLGPLFVGIREVQERVSERIEKVPERYVDGTLKARMAERGRQTAVGNNVVVRSSVRVCVCACDVLCMCIQFVAPPCADQKRGPNSRLLLYLIPGHAFTTI